MDKIDEMLEEYLGKVYIEIVRKEEDILKSLSDITHKEIRTLEVINNCRGGNNNPSQISGILGISLGTLTTNINRLISKGFVCRERSLEDKRIMLITLTDKGQDLLKRYYKEHKRLINKALEKFTSKEKVVIVSLISKIEI